MKMDMTKGNVTKLILMFALPLFLSNLFQQFYNIADTAIVGHTLGDHALSAVGSVSVIFGLIMSICFGMTNGFSIIISKYFGAKQENHMKQAIAGTIMLSAAVCICLTLVCSLLLKWFMRCLHTPSEIFQDAYAYISIIVFGLIVMVFYNMLASLLRAIGNSTTPLVFLVISSLLNIGMDFWFIVGLQLGIAGAAYATVLAQLISAVLCAIYMIRKCPMMHVKREHFHISTRMLRELLASGLAMSLMYAIVNVGTVVLQSGINGLGATTIAAHVSARKISEIYMMPCATLSGTMATFASQNYGAGKMNRVWEGVKKTHLIGWIWATMAIIITYVFAPQLITAITGSSNAKIIATGVKYLKINLPFYYILMILCILRSTLQGIGSKLLPVFASLLEMLGKIVTVQFFVAPFGYIAICFCEPMTWIICSVVVIIAFFSNKGIKKCFQPDTEKSIDII